MHVKKNGYVSGALLMHNYVKKLRNQVELEKFQCRMLKDDETTRKFKKKTENHKNKLHKFRYCNEMANKLTAQHRNKNE